VDPFTSIEWANDPHAIARRPRAVLCCPLRQNRRTAAIYLDHVLRREVFADQQVETIRLLSTQLAISLENARLYARQIKLTEAAQRFVPKEFLALLGKSSVDDIALNDHTERDMTILVCDIRGFTSLSEKMTAEDSFEYINRFFALIGPVIREHDGFVIKYMGDGLMALFPQRPDDAVAASQAMLRIVENISALKLGIGIHYGRVSLGAVGEESRIQSDVMSDVANVACRLEALTRELDVASVISSSAWLMLDPPSQSGGRSLGSYFVKGRQETIEIFTLS
jgi:class 3 adenylate cyclase